MLSTWRSASSLIPWGDALGGYQQHDVNLVLEVLDEIAASGYDFRRISDRVYLDHVVHVVALNLICGGKPRRPQRSDKPVAIVKWVDGTVLDTVWQIA